MNFIIIFYQKYKNVLLLFTILDKKRFIYKFFYNNANPVNLCINKVIIMFLKSKNSETKLDLNFKMYIDFDLNIGVFYFNFYLVKYKFILKTALTPPLNANENFWDNATNNGDYLHFKYEKFNLTKYAYLLHYE